LREQGKTLDETYAYLEENKNCFHQMGWLDDLSFVASKGRISHSAAFFGQMIGIKPLGDTDYNGLTTVIGKAKGEKQAFNAIIAYIKATIVNPQDQIILIAQTNREKPSLKLKELIEKEIKPKEIILSDVFIADGINIGPGLMAAFYFGKPISKEGLQEEKNLMASILGK
jgi:fatty acid-binding protein DegV